mgnify:CR=1 FL=1
MAFFQGPMDLISIHAPRAGGDRYSPLSSAFPKVFQSTPPVRGATKSGSAITLYCYNFNPRPPCGGRLLEQPVAPLRADFNPRPPCGGRHGGYHVCDDALEISIHAPRAGGDREHSAPPIAAQGNFNPRPPCGGRPFCAILAHVVHYFNPRPPCGGRRRYRRGHGGHGRDFNPRPPCGGRPRNLAPCGREQTFQSTPPVRGATASLYSTLTQDDISIHAPRAGGDPTPQIVTAGAGVFQSTPPVRGATIFGITHNTPHKNFNPRPPCGGRLTKLDRWSRKVKISIHAPRAGGDFILTSPRSVFSIISIHAPRAGGDGYFVAVHSHLVISIHAPRAGGDRPNPGIWP